MFGRLYHLPSPTARQRADELLEQFDLADAGDLKAEVGGERVEVVVHDPARLAAAREVIAGECRAEVSVQEHVRRVTAPTQGGSGQLVFVIRALDEASIAIDDIGLRRPTLDDVFLSLTGHAAEQEPTGDAPEAAAATPTGRTS